MLRLAAVASLAIVMALLPVKVDPTSTDVIAVNEACAQATSCKKSVDYICSTFNGDHEDYVCWTGCGGN